jgi:hypothetical protein
MTLALAGVSESALTVIVGDQHKGGRKPSPEERRRLSSRGHPGVPRGLERCETCGEWRGECLDPGPVARGLLVRVSCRCEGQSRCARCRVALHERRLETSHYDEGTRQLRFVSGLVALGHHCGEAE